MAGRCFLVCVVLFLFTGNGSAQQLNSTTIHEIIAQQLSAHSNTSPGSAAAVRVSVDESIVAAYGVADKKTQTPVSDSTRFFSGSTGKTMTAVVVTTLIADGVIALDDPISKYLSRKEWFAELNNHNDITIRMLLNHSAGIASYLDNKTFFLSQRGRRLKGYTPDELVTYVATEAPSGIPGQHFSYSDTHYIILGMIIEKVTGKQFYDLVQEIILDPLQLVNTTPLVGREHERLANAYRKGGLLRRSLKIAGPTLKNERLKFIPDYEWTGGGFVTTPEDLATFYYSLFTDDRFARQRALMISPENLNPVSEKVSYGLGVYVVMRNTAGPVYSHGGDFMGYRSAVFYDAASNVAVAVQANAKTYEPIDVGYAILKALKESRP
jgi:D-alanyl-D-alanine carboxypeptidase